MIEKKKYHYTGDLKEDLAFAALDIIRESGLEQVTLKRIASKLDVTSAALYHHYKSREELIKECAFIMLNKIYKLNNGKKIDSIDDFKVLVEETLLNDRAYLMLAFSDKKCYKAMVAQFVGLARCFDSTQPAVDVVINAFYDCIDV